MARPYCQTVGSQRLLRSGWPASTVGVTACSRNTDATSPKLGRWNRKTARNKANLAPNSPPANKPTNKKWLELHARPLEK